MVACPCALTPAQVYPEAKQIPTDEIQRQIRAAFPRRRRALFRAIRGATRYRRGRARFSVLILEETRKGTRKINPHERFDSGFIASISCPRVAVGTRHLVSNLYLRNVVQ